MAQTFHNLRGWARNQVLKRFEIDELEPTPSHPSAARVADDGLTGTLSRSAFASAVGTALRGARRDGRGVGVIVLDIDQFTGLNHTHGTDIGNLVLREAAARLLATVRPGDAVARIGGDAFAVLCRTGSDHTHTRDVAHRIQRAFDTPIETAVAAIPITISIGIATATDHEAIDIDPAGMMRDAESAAARAADLGRSQLVTFDREVQDRASERYRTEQDLRKALADQALDVHFQPIVNLISGEVVGVEALARWTHSELGPISPGLFIPVAEETGLIGELSARVMAATVHQGSRWNAERHDTLVTMNLSSRQLVDPQLSRFIRALLEANDLHPARLCLEITESVVMHDVATSMTILGELKDMGVCLAIDDFGTGYSSLSYLRRLPVDILKIDRSFVQNIQNRDDRVIAKAVIDLAHTLGMTTIAEGVETQLQLEVLKALDCDMAQGFLLAHPAPASQIDLSAVDLANPGSLDMAAMPDSGRVLPF